MGLYDIPYLLAVPNMIVTAPRDGEELLALLRLGVEQQQGPFALRYPRDNVPAAVPALEEIPPVPFGTWEVLRRGQDLALLAVGTMVQPALAAARELESHGLNPTVVNCRFLKPHDDVSLKELVRTHGALLTLEEGTVVNGFGALVARLLEADRRNGVPYLDVLGVPDRIIEHATRAEQLEECGLDVPGIVARARALAEHAHLPAARVTA
jgi:1-deoxy-D-xylulose-5-phosphate synthase